MKQKKYSPELGFAEITKLTDALAKMKEQRDRLFERIGCGCVMGQLCQHCAEAFNAIESPDAVKDECSFCKGHGFWFIKKDNGPGEKIDCDQCHGTGKREAK